MVRIFNMRNICPRYRRVSVGVSRKVFQGGVTEHVRKNKQK
jgi:hypothetical protein